MGWDYLIDASLGFKWAAALPTNPAYRRSTGDPLGPVVLTAVQGVGGLPQGPANGETVTIVGDNFFDVQLVTFGGRAAGNVVVVDPQHITCDVPPGTSGQTVTLRVVCLARPTAKLTNAFTYTAAVVPTVASVTPNNGPDDGGTLVEITGRYFLGALSATVNGISLTSLEVVSNTKVRGVTRESIDGVGNVVVTTPTGAGTLTNGWEYKLMNLSDCGGRLTLSSANPVPAADVTGASTVYYTPHLSGRVPIFDGTRWNTRTFTEISIVLSALTSGKNYDVFAYWTGTAVALELGAAWANDTTRADLLTRQDGVLVKSANNTRRYLGTIRTTGAATTEDSALRRFVWNMYNRVTRGGSVTDATVSWTYASAAFRQVRATAANRVEMVVGQASTVSADATVLAANGASGRAAFAGIGIDSTTTNSGVSMSQFASVSFASETNPGQSRYDGLVAEGYHAINWLEGLSGANSTTIYGTSSGSTSGLRTRHEA